MMNYNETYFDEDYDDIPYIDDFGMDYLFSANVSSCEYAERTLRLLDIFRQEGSTVTFTFDDGEVLNTGDIFSVSRLLDNVQIEFQSVCENLVAEINVFPIAENEYEIILMLPHEELKKLSREKVIFDIAVKFFECLSPKYGVTGEEVYAMPSDEITDDDFVFAFQEIGYIDSCQFNMTARVDKYKKRFVTFPLRCGELYIDKDFEKELRRQENKK